MDAKFAENAVSVSDRGFERDAKFCGDLFAGQTRDQEPYDIHFAVGESKLVCRARRTGVSHKFSPFQAQLSWVELGITVSVYGEPAGIANISEISVPK